MSTKFRPETFGLSEGKMVGESVTVRRSRVRESEVMRTRVLEARALIKDALAGDRRAALTLNEAITTSDLFKAATGEVLDQEMLAAYEAQPTQWGKFAARTTVADFRPKRLVDLIGGTASLARVPEHSNYPASKYDTEEKTIRVEKFGEQFGYTFEARINDQIGELETVPAGWANKTRYTEDDVALETLADPTTGAPNTSFFNVGNDNIGTGLLTATSLDAAIVTVSTRRDANDRLLNPGPLQLVVGPALAPTAQRILNAQEIRETDGDGNVTVRTNDLAGRITLQVLANLPGTAWFVLPTPSAPRPAFYVAFLRGFETPDVRWKGNQGNSLGGGALGADSGSFEDDTIYYRVRHIVGGGEGDPRFTYASDGIAVE